MIANLFRAMRHLRNERRTTATHRLKIRLINWADLQVGREKSAKG